MPHPTVVQLDTVIDILAGLQWRSGLPVELTADVQAVRRAAVVLQRKLIAFTASREVFDTSPAEEEEIERRDVDEEERIGECEG